MKNNQKGWLTAVIALAAILFTIFPSGIRAAEKAGAANEPRAYKEWTLVAGRVTMIDLGATECIPCKMMAPILAELQREYDGKEIGRAHV
jgi:thioredoxin 1